MLKVVATAGTHTPTEEGDGSTTDATASHHAVLGKHKAMPVPNPEEAPASLPRENEEVDSVSASSSSPVAPPTETTTCPNASAAVVFVGFGSGAHSLLHLAAGPLLPLSPKCSTTVDTTSSGGRCIRDNTSTPDASRGGSESGRLALVLDRRGLRISGLVLVNGFVSLDEQSEQVRCYLGSRKSGNF